MSQIESKWVKLNHNESNWVIQSQYESNWVIMSHTESKGVKFNLRESKSHNESNRPKMSQKSQIKSNWVKMSQIVLPFVDFHGPLRVQLDCWVGTFELSGPGVTWWWLRLAPGQCWQWGPEGTRGTSKRTAWLCSLLVGPHLLGLLRFLQSFDKIRQV